MGKFGTGCCTGGYQFAGNAGWKPPPGDSQAGEGVPPCDPILLDIGGAGNMSFAPTGIEWPKWGKNSGCGTIALLKLNEVFLAHIDPMKYGGEGAAPVLTPANMKWIAECVDKCLGKQGGYGVRDGIDRYGPENECLIKCKEELMEEVYQVSADLSAYVTSATASSIGGYSAMSGLSSICPPLCVKGTVVLGIHVKYLCWTWEKPWITSKGGMGWTRSGEAKWSGPVVKIYDHAVMCTTVSCTPAGACFDCQDYGPQAKYGPYKICMNADGIITLIDRPDTHLGPPGSCAKKMKNPSYSGDPWADPNEWLCKGCQNEPRRIGDSCCEQYYDTGGEWPRDPFKPLVETIWTDVPCPTGGTG